MFSESRRHAAQSQLIKWVEVVCRRRPTIKSNLVCNATSETQVIGSGFGCQRTWALKSMEIAVGIYFRKLPTRNFHLLHKICRTLYELECNRVGVHRSYDDSDGGVSDRSLSRPRGARALLHFYVRSVTPWSVGAHRGYEACDGGVSDKAPSRLRGSRALLQFYFLTGASRRLLALSDITTATR